MGINIASLFATVGVNTDPLNNGLGSAKQSLTQFGGEMAKQVVGTASLAAAVYKAGQAAIESVNDWANYADAMRLSAQMAGVTTEEMSRLTQAADDFRIPIETMQRSMEMALKNGFVPTIENVANLADKLLAIDDPALRAAEASKIFGKSYADMMPFLLAGGDAIRQSTANIDDNLVVTAEAAQKAKEYKDQLDNLGDAWTGLKNTFGQFLVPVATDMFTSLTENLTGGVDQTILRITALKALLDKKIDWGEFFSILGSSESAEGIANAGDEIARLNTLIGATAPTADAAATGVAALTEEELALVNASIATAEAQAKMHDELMNVTSLDANYSGIIDLGYEFTDMLAEQETLQAERNKLLSQGWSEQSTKVKELTDNIAGLDADMKKMADQVTLDMFKATIAIGGVTQAELAAYMDMAVDMGYMSEAGAEAAIKAYGDAIKTIDGMDIDEKTGNVNIDAAAAFITLDLLQQYAILDKEARVFVRTFYGTSGSYDPYENYTGPDYQHGGGASGGYFMADTPYIVGEKGPELFVPNANGQIVSNNMLGGGNGEMLGDILLELQNQPARIKVAIKEAFALVGG